MEESEKSQPLIAASYATIQRDIVPNVMNGTLQPDVKTYIAQLREAGKAGKSDLILNFRQFLCCKNLTNKPGLSKSTTVGRDAR